MPGRPEKEPVFVHTWPEPLWQCSCCMEPLPESRFPADKRASNGLSSWCRRCHREDARMRRAISGTGSLGDWRRRR